MPIPVILAGGSGTRLWPLSRRLDPKPFLVLPDGQPLIANALRRARALSEQALVVCGSEHAHRIAALAPEGLRLRFLLEPVGRNTAPAVLAAALLWSELEEGEEELLILPADHFVSPLEAFLADVEKASELTAEGAIVVFGITPDRPATGFGYIELGARWHRGHHLAAFVEKPERERAERMLASGRYLWNAGMFQARIASLLAQAEALAPEVLRPCREALAERRPHPLGWQLPEARWGAVPEIAFDYAVMERGGKRAVVPASFSWSDIGDFAALAALLPADAEGNRCQGRAYAIGARDCTVLGGARPVVLIGAERITVADTGDAVLVVRSGQEQQVRAAVSALKAAGEEAAETPRTVHRPWGCYTVLEDAADCKVKRLSVRPGGILSLQRHRHRSEHWTVVQGVAKVRVGERELVLRRNESIDIPAGSLHRLENPGPEPLELIEVQTGDYFGEDDIERFEDVYGRV